MCPSAVENPGTALQPAFPSMTANIGPAYWRVTLAFGSLLLVLGTWPLWIPQSEYPRVPLLASELSLPTQWDYGLSWLLLLTWLSSQLALSLPWLPIKLAQRTCLGYVFIFGFLVITNQHRLQPWAVHIGLSLLIVTWLDRASALRWLTWLWASIYIHSAISKFDAQFLNTVGMDLARTALSWLGWRWADISQETAWVFALVFPLGELTCGVMLLWRGCQFLAWPLSIGMHMMLLLILGPLGLNHSWGVLLWNCVFIVLNSFMWRESQTISQQSYENKSRNLNSAQPFGWAVKCLIALAFVWPLGERVGWVDHWLGWALYAPHSSRAEVWLTESSLDHLPPNVRRFVGEPNELGWRRLEIDRWSIAALGVPIYPQQRFQVGVAQAIGNRVDEFAIQVVLKSAANRWTGKRTERTLVGKRELGESSKAYWWNSQPRW